MTQGQRRPSPIPVIDPPSVGNMTREPVGKLRLASCRWVFASGFTPRSEEIHVRVCPSLDVGA